jgi:chemotaxis protein CheD
MKQMKEIGAVREKVVAKVIGGAMMFEGFERHAIGKRNVQQARAVLQEVGISVIAEDVFGNWGRSIFFNVADGIVNVKSFKHGDKIL